MVDWCGSNNSSNLTLSFCSDLFWGATRASTTIFNANSPFVITSLIFPSKIQTMRIDGRQFSFLVYSSAMTL